MALKISLYLKLNALISPTPEPEFEYFPKPVANKNDMFIRVGAESSDEFIKKNGSQSTDEVGIAFFPNFSDLSAKLGRVQVVEHNLKIKTICVYLTLITLYFSGIGASEFKQIVEKRLDEERNRISTPSQTWLIPHPKSSSWGDLKDYNKVSLVKNIIGYTPRINTKGDERNMRIYLKRSSKSE